MWLEGFFKMTVDDVEEKARSVANHALTALFGKMMILVGIPVMIGIGSWSLGAVIDIQSRVGKLEQWTKDNGHDLYHGADATRDFSRRDDRIGQNSIDISKLDGRVSYIERDGKH